MIRDNKNRTLALIVSAALCLALIVAAGLGTKAFAVTEEAETTENSVTVIDISGAEVTGITNKTCTGKAITQNITVKVNGKTLVGGEDYTVAYENNKAVGTALVRIIGTGDDVEGGYVGTIEKTFKISSRVQKNFYISGIKVYCNSNVLIDDKLPSNALPTSFILTGQKNSIKLSWNTPTGINDIDGFIIFKKVNGKYKQIATVAKTKRSYVDKNASKKNTDYRYVLVSYKKSGSNIKITPSTTPWVSGVTTRSYKTNVYSPKFKNGSSISILTGENETLKVKFPARPRNKALRWWSSNSAVASVSSTGVVTGNSTGTAVIYARTATGRVISCKVKVSNILKGVDVSTWQNTINWTSVKNAGIQFAFIRCGFTAAATGVPTQDNYFDKNMTNATAVGMPVGAYYFTLANNTSMAKREADMAVEWCRKYKLSYPIVVDVEAVSGSLANCTYGKKWNNLSKADRTAVVKAFCDEIKAKGYTPMIYASTSYLENKLDMTKLSAYQVWVAQYYTVCQYEGAYKCWQYTSSGKVNGIGGYVDLNYWYG